MVWLLLILSHTSTCKGQIISEPKLWCLKFLQKKNKIIVRICGVPSLPALYLTLGIPPRVSIDTTVNDSSLLSRCPYIK